MSQFDSNAYVDTESGTQAVARLNNSFSAHQTEHSGTSRPAYAVANMIWLDTSSTPWLLKMFDGAADITMGEINATTNEFNPYTGSTVFSDAVASLTVSGRIEIATVAETNTGTDATRAVSPAGLTGWTGDTAVVTVGTVSTGTWRGTAVAEAYIADNSITLAKMSHGVDGNVITYDSLGAPAAVATGSSGQVLTSGGAGVAPTFATAATTDLAAPGPIGGTTPSTVATTTVSSTAGANLVTASGNVGVGTASAAAKMDIDQSSPTAAIPVLRLDQADVSEEMISFETTVGTGNAIEAASTKVLTTTHYIKVELPGGLTRYIPVGTIAEPPGGEP